MKIRTIHIIIIFTTCILFFCKKKETPKTEAPLVTSEMVNGLPGSTDTISGYLFADYWKKPNFAPYVHLYSAFREPSGDLLTSYNHYTYSYWDVSSKASYGNINVGRVTFNNQYILSSYPSKPSFHYYYNQSATQDNPLPVWSTEGNKTFCPINMMVERGFPILNVDSASVAVISLSGFTLDINNATLNYDSLVVLIDDNYSATKAIRKGIGAIKTPIIFSANDFKNLGQGIIIGSIYVYAFNYSHKTIENRVYVFELSNKFSQSIQFIP